MKGLVCPVSFQKINQNSSRLSVFFLVCFIGLYLWTGSIWFMIAVAFDYVFRIFEKVKFSPLTFITHYIFKLFKLPVKHVNKGPKVFASRMGLLFALLSIGFFYYNPTVSIVFACILLLCTFLDSVFNVCFGCLIYHYLVFPFYNDDPDYKPE